MYTRNTVKPKRGYVKSAAALLALGLVSCVGFYYADNTSPQVYESFEQLMQNVGGMNNELELAQKISINIKINIKQTTKYLEEEIKADVPNFKGVLAAFAKLNSDVVDATTQIIDDVKPDNISSIVKFVHAHSDWLKKNHFNLTPQIEEI